MKGVENNMATKAPGAAKSVGKGKRKPIYNAAKNMIKKAKG